MAISHANCTHPRTPAGRKACRAANDAGGTTFNAYVPPSHDDVLKDAAIVTPAPVRRAHIARLQARLDGTARIQPRKAGARVSLGGSTCIQAALHALPGRCACGEGVMLAGRP
jgi:hypothetical protein